MNYKTNRDEVIEELIERDGYIHCQHCGVSQSFKFHCHHIFFRSEKPNHPELHNKKNLIILCDQCHSLHHGDKSIRDEIVEERNLIKLFE